MSRLFIIALSIYCIIVALTVAMAHADTTTDMLVFDIWAQQQEMMFQMEQERYDRQYDRVSTDPIAACVYLISRVPRKRAPNLEALIQNALKNCAENYGIGR